MVDSPSRPTRVALPPSLKHLERICLYGVQGIWKISSRDKQIKRTMLLNPMHVIQIGDNNQINRVSLLSNIVRVGNAEGKVLFEMRPGCDDLDWLFQFRDDPLNSHKTPSGFMATLDQLWRVAAQSRAPLPLVTTIVRSDGRPPNIRNPGTPKDKRRRSEKALQSVSIPRSPVSGRVPPSPPKEEPSVEEPSESPRMMWDDLHAMMERQAGKIRELEARLAEEVSSNKHLYQQVLTAIGESRSLEEERERVRRAEQEAEREKNKESRLCKAHGILREHCGPCTDIVEYMAEELLSEHYSDMHGSGNWNHGHGAAFYSPYPSYSSPPGHPMMMTHPMTPQSPPIRLNVIYPVKSPSFGY